MQFTNFEIKNFKGIDKANINLKKSGGNVFTLIGLNESGKTTFLEAISFLIDTPDQEKHQPIFGESFSFLKDTSKLIPLKSFSNFNDPISVKATLSFPVEDKDRLNKILATKYPDYQFEISGGEFKIEKKLTFENSNLKKTEHLWTISISQKGKKERKFKEIGASSQMWQDIVKLIKEHFIPHIFYFPSFLFNFPKEIYLDSATLTGQDKIINDYYKEILQDILHASDSKADLKTHILERLQKDDDQETRMAKHLLSQMGAAFSKEFLKRWVEIFKQQTGDKKSIVIDYGKNKDKNLFYLSFKLKDEPDEYFISERSLGFRWFFAFLLFTELRSQRLDEKNILFLLDEPASNLHSSAQQEILSSFERTTTKKNHTIVFSTHSHYLINPNWLENAFICQNKAIDYEMREMDQYDSHKAQISITPYRQFVSQHSDKTTYFQPVLDVLEYRPCLLEYIPNAVIMEGKTDNYIINYFKEIIFNNEHTGDFSIVPGMNGCESLDGVVRLYLGWGKTFLVLLDGDKAGNIAYQKYKSDFLLSDEQIATLNSINASFTKIESLVSAADKERYNIKKKGALNVLLKENLATRTIVNFDDETKNNFKSLLLFLKTHFEKYVNSNKPNKK